MTDIAAGAAAAPHGVFRVGHVISKSIGIYARHAVTFTLIAGVLWFPAVLTSFYLESSPRNLAQWEPLAVILFTLTLQPLSVAIILHASFQDMRGRKVSLGQSIAHCIRRLPALLGVTFLTLLGTVLGAMLLVIPGIIVMVMWYVAVPVCIVEGEGAIRSMDRSQALTRGHRWKIFGLYLLTVIIAAIGDSVLPDLAAKLTGTAGTLAIRAVWQGFAQAVDSVMIVVAYHDLRVAKEGVDIERIASVFD